MEQEPLHMTLSFSNPLVVHVVSGNSVLLDTTTATTQEQPLPHFLRANDVNQAVCESLCTVANSLQSTARHDTMSRWNVNGLSRLTWSGMIHAPRPSSIACGKCAPMTKRMVPHIRQRRNTSGTNVSFRFASTMTRVWRLYVGAPELAH